MVSILSIICLSYSILVLWLFVSRAHYEPYRNGLTSVESLKSRASLLNLRASAILLSYKRRGNLPFIVDTLFESGIFDEVIIWNNDIGNPLDTSIIKSPDSKKMTVRIHESENNGGTINRYEACVLAKNPVCFFQDDDWNTSSYIVPLYASFLDEPHLPHVATAYYEVNDINTIRVSQNESIGLHSQHVWIGCGTFLRKEDAKRHIVLAKKHLTDDLVPFKPTDEEYKATTRANEPIFHSDIAFTAFMNVFPVLFVQNLVPLKDLSSPISNGRPTQIFFQKLSENVRDIVRRDLEAGGDTFVQSNYKTRKFERTLCKYSMCAFISSKFELWHLDNLPLAVDGDSNTMWKSKDVIKAGDWFGIDWFEQRTNVKVDVDCLSVSVQKELHVELSRDGFDWKEGKVDMKCSLKDLKCTYKIEMGAYRAMRFVSKNSMEDKFGVREITYTVQ